MPLPLPKENSIPVQRRTLKLSAVGLLVFMIVANFAALVLLRSYTPNEGYSLIRHKWKMLQNDKGDVDYLVLGDSSINQGVDTGLLGKLLGGRAINLATIGNMTLVNDVLETEYYLEHHKPPKAIIVGHVYDVWHRPFATGILAETPFEWPELENRMKWLEFGSSQDFIDYGLARYVPLYSQSTSIPRAVGIRLLRPNRKGMIARVDETGFMHETKPSPEGTRGDSLSHTEFVHHNEPHLHPQNVEGLRRLISIAKRLNIPLIYCNSPINGELYQNADFQKFYNKISELIAVEVQKEPKNFYAFRTPMTFDPNEMQNADHVIASAAEKYTVALAKQLQPILGTPPIP